MDPVKHGMFSGLGVGCVHFPDVLRSEILLLALASLTLIVYIHFFCPLKSVFI
jgi:hypothetical protein